MSSHHALFRLALGLALLVLAVGPSTGQGTYTYSAAGVPAPTALPPQQGSTVYSSRAPNVVFDISIFNAYRTSTHGHYVQGTCTVERVAPLDVPPGGLGVGEHWFLCGVDRDNDAYVTNVDLSGSLDADGYDDDFASRSGLDASVAVCFRADQNDWPWPQSSQWDSMMVAIAGPTPVTVDVEVELTAVADGSCVPSAHTHSSWT